MDWFSWLSRTNLEPTLIYEYGLAFNRNELQLEDATHFNHEFLQSMGVSIAKHRLEILKVAKKVEQHAAKSGNKKFAGAVKKCLKKFFNKLVSREAIVMDEPNWGNNWRRARHNNNNNYYTGNHEIKGTENKMQRSRTIAFSGPLDGTMLHGKMVNNININKVMNLSGPLDGKMMYANTNSNANECRSPLMNATTNTTHTRAVNGGFVGSAKCPRLSGPLDATPTMVCNRSPRPLDDESIESPIGYSPYNKVRSDPYYDHHCALWPTLFEDLRPT